MRGVNRMTSASQTRKAIPMIVRVIGSSCFHKANGEVGEDVGGPDEGVPVSAMDGDASAGQQVGETRRLSLRRRQQQAGIAPDSLANRGDGRIRSERRDQSGNG